MKTCSRLYMHGEMEFSPQPILLTILICIHVTIITASSNPASHLTSQTSLYDRANRVDKKYPSNTIPNHLLGYLITDVKNNNPEHFVQGPEELDLGGVFGPGTGSSLTGNKGRNVHRSVRDAGSGNPVATKSISMPLADHSPGTSMAERPMAFIDWSQAPIKDEPQPPSHRNVAGDRQRLLADGRSMAEAILLGKKELWRWNYVTRSPPFTKTGDHYYGLSCCTKLPYICGVDGMCVLQNPGDCELFCQCASDHKMAHCQRTIPRIKSVMRKLETSLINDVATEKRIVVPPTLEKQLKLLESFTMATRAPPSSSLFPLPLPVSDHTDKINQKHTTSLTFVTQPGIPSTNSTTSATVPTTITMSRGTTASSTPAPVSTTPDRSKVKIDQTPNTVPTSKQEDLTTTSLAMIPSTDTIEIDENDLDLLRKADTGFGVRTVIHTTLKAEETSLVRSQNVSHDHCWQCEETGGACVMGNDFRAHCVKELVDGCVHFHCVHGSCISTDGSYSCECQKGWIGTFCDQPCSIQCGHNGYCSRVTDRIGPNNISVISDVMTGRMGTDLADRKRQGEVTCVCHWNFTGDNCDQKRKLIPGIQKILIPSDQIETWQIIVVVISTSVFMASFLIIMTYFLWRRQWLPLRKLVYFFQDHEDDDGKQYDAFISYKGCPRDERFVLNHLYPKLEKELDFRLCLHFRDFPPGHPIANNIIHAIENSRRTIMILSPAYVKSEWCRMEYQKAQHEMLRLRHRLIPVVLEDIRDVPGVDKNLQTILETITYIKWPGEMENAFSKRSSHFWKLLELSMPKKKPDCSRSVISGSSDSSNPSMTSSSRSYFSHLVESLSAYSFATDSNHLVNILTCNPNPKEVQVQDNEGSQVGRNAALDTSARTLTASFNNNNANTKRNTTQRPIKEWEHVYDKMYGVCSDDTSVSLTWKSDWSNDYPSQRH